MTQRFFVFLLLKLPSLLQELRYFFTMILVVTRKFKIIS